MTSPTLLLISSMVFSYVMRVNDGNYRPFVVYEPSAEYRLVSLHGNRPLYNLDLSIFYKTKFGDLIPFTLASGASVTLKLAFFKKSMTSLYLRWSRKAF